MRRKSMMFTLALSLAACGGGDDSSGVGGNSGASNGVSGGTNTGSNASGGGSSAGSNTGAGTGGNPSVCQDIQVSAAPTTPDMLIVLDRSGSMKRGSVNRWDPSVSAVRAVTSMLEDRIRFGLMLFPRGGFGGGSCTPGELEVEVEIENADAISRALNGQPSGGTPTGETLEAAFEALDPNGGSPDEVIPPKYVLLVTDGQPTCPAGDGSADPPEQADIDLTTGALDKLLQAGVQTYVIGYDTQNDPAFATLMDTFAMHGGTGKHRAVENEATLVEEFSKIAGEAIPCSYNLDMEPEDPSYVKVTLDGRQLNLGDPNGWSISGTVISLQGTACSSLKDGQQHTVQVQVTCDQVTPI